MREIIPLEMELRKAVWWANQQLPKNGLVAWTSGNVSGRNKTTGIVVIKASGVPYGIMSPTGMVLVGSNGNVIDDPICATVKPSVDTPTHLYLYKNMPEVNGICHTHSPYATAFAVSGKDIYCISTMQADEFGGHIRCSGAVRYGGSLVDAEILFNLKERGASLVKGHGVLTVGKTPEESVKRAVFVEECAKLAYLTSDILAFPVKFLPDADVKEAHERYKESYGQ